MFDDLSKSVCASKNYLTLSFLNMITGYNELKKLLKHKSIANVILMVGNVTRIKIRLTINDFFKKNFCAKTIIFGILNVLVKMLNI